MGTEERDRRVAAVQGLEAMAIQRATDEASIRQRIDELVEALRAMDLEGVMSLYAPDIVSFDIVPPLRHVGAKLVFWGTPPGTTPGR